MTQPQTPLRDQLEAADFDEAREADWAAITRGRRPRVSPALAVGATAAAIAALVILRTGKPPRPPRPAQWR